MFDCKRQILALLCKRHWIIYANVIIRNHPKSAKKAKHHLSFKPTLRLLKWTRDFDQTDKCCISYFLCYPGKHWFHLIPQVNPLVWKLQPLGHEFKAENNRVFRSSKIRLLNTHPQFCDLFRQRERERESRNYFLSDIDYLSLFSSQV